MIKERFQVNTVITSPPYWNQRDYGIPPSIWDGDPNCKHNWKEIILKSSHGKTFGENKNLIHLNKDTSSNFCSKCGAWLGSLGSEPDFNLYIKHLCDIYDLVWQVLKPTGTNWVNLGDTYSSGGRSVSKEYFKKEYKG